MLSKDGNLMQHNSMFWYFIPFFFFIKDKKMKKKVNIKFLYCRIVSNKRNK